jgi:hypothetical protein
MHRRRRLRHARGGTSTRSCSRSSDARAGAWQPSALRVPQWLHREPPCCSWDNAAYATSALCPQGEAVQAAVRSAFELGAGSFQARPDRLLPVGGNACACEPSRRQQLAMEWEPNGCRLHEWSAEAFCAALGRRRLLFVGDSTMQQLATVVMNGVAWEEAQASGCDAASSHRHRTARRLHREEQQEQEQEAAAGPCRRRISSISSSSSNFSCSSQLLFGHSDTLVARPLGHGSGVSRGEHWLRWADASGAEVVVLGATAHIYGASNFSAMLREVAEGARPRPRLRVLWATSTPGGCGPRPLQRLPPHTPPPELPFQWGEFRQRDEEARAFFAREAPHVRLLELEPLHFRVDAHIKPGADCLHMCIPGPLSVVPRLLQLELGALSHEGSRARS